MSFPASPSQKKTVCPLGKPFCDPNCKYYDRASGKCKLLAQKLGDCLTC